MAAGPGRDRRGRLGGHGGAAGAKLLLGGEPGAGKSTILQLLVAVGALDPSVRLTLLDPKLVELAGWQGCAARLVGPSVDEAIDVLKGLVAEVDDRYLTCWPIAPAR